MLETGPGRIAGAYKPISVREFHMTSKLTSIRTIVLTAFILAAGFTSAFATSGQDAAAAGPCVVITIPGTNRLSNGAVVVSGSTSIQCTGIGNQSVSATLYQNGTVVARVSGAAWTSGFSGQTGRVYCKPGAVYQTEVLHTFNGVSTRHWSAGYRMC
jgi:hypothetical protein